MRMNRLEKALLRDEGLRLKPYRDSVGKLTIGIGRNLDDVGITEDEAISLMRNDIRKVKGELNQFAWYRRLDELRKEVLINMCFNMGLPTLLKFKNMIKALDECDYLTAADEMLDSLWASQVGERAVRLARIMRGQ